MGRYRLLFLKSLLLLCIQHCLLYIEVTASFSPQCPTKQTIAFVARSHPPNPQHRLSNNHISRIVANRGISSTKSCSWKALAANIPGGGEIGDDRQSNSELLASTTAPTPTGEDAAVVQGRILLCLVALLYGTLNVSLRLIYQLPDPPTAAALSTARGWLASIGFVPLIFFRPKANEVYSDNGGEEPISSTSEYTAGSSSTSSTSSSSSPFSAFLFAGIELAFWNFLAQGLLNIGLLSTTSARASFLTQTSVVITPVLSRLIGQRVAPKVWIACGLALVGLTILAAAGGPVAAAAVSGGLSIQSMMNFSTGDWLVLGGALSWSLYLLRLSNLGPKFDEINLQFVKTTLLAVFYTLWLVAVPVLGSAGLSATTAVTTTPGTTFGWLMSGSAGLFLLYSAMGPGTIADVLQQQGQKQLSASEANVILSMEPVFAALCAWLILGEVTSIQEAVGGGIILTAALVATR
jgi:drug/metabolite transporter (DMT)-like permease